MRGFRQVVWSPVEVEYLQKHQGDSVSQLTIALSKSTTAVKRKLQELDGKPITKKSEVGRTQTSKKGRRKDCNNQFFRSSWEANVFRWLRHISKKGELLEYEPTTFSFAPFGVLKGTVSYCPDFKLSFPEGQPIEEETSHWWIEVKGGFMKSQDKVKIRRFKKYYPEEFKRLRAITPGENSKTALFFKSLDIPIIAYYPSLNKEFRYILPNWE
jgi:hypothetical protein